MLAVSGVGERKGCLLIQLLPTMTSREMGQLERLILRVQAARSALRFHGPDGNYRGTYTDDFLYENAGYIRDWISEGKQVYVYFNNTMGEAVSNLQSLNRYVMNADN